MSNLFWICLKLFPNVRTFFFHISTCPPSPTNQPKTYSHCITWFGKSHIIIFQFKSDVTSLPDELDVKPRAFGLCYVEKKTDLYHNCWTLRKNCLLSGSHGPSSTHNGFLAGTNYVSVYTSQNPPNSEGQTKTCIGPAAYKSSWYVQNFIYRVYDLWTHHAAVLW